MARRISHPQPRPEERKTSITLPLDQARWLDGVLADARRGGALGIGTSALVRFALARLQKEDQVKVVAELIRGRGQDQ